METNVTIMRRPQVEAATGLARSTIYKWVKDGQFPAPVKIGVRQVGWKSTDVQGWIQSKFAAGVQS